MKKFSCLLLPGMIAAGILAMPAELHACGPFLQPSYYGNDGNNVYDLQFNRGEALKRLIKLCDDMVPTKSKLPEGISSKEAISRDFAGAVKRYLPDMNSSDQQRIVESYASFIARGRYNFGGFPALPEALEEFKLYRMGVKELYDSRDPEFVPPSWQKLLQLPPEKRHYRTTWVLFMLGNHLKDPKYYQACRDAARAGFADTAGLGRASYINEFLYSKSLVKQLHVWAEAFKSDPELELTDNIRFSKSVFHTCSDQEYMELLADPLGREVLAVFGNYNRVAFIKTAHQYKFRNADVIACYYYSRGDTDIAASWLTRIEKPTLLSLYLEARIARIEGKISLAASKLKAWLEMAKNIDPKDNKYMLECLDAEGETFPLERDVYGWLGNTRVMRRDFVEAAEFFYHAGQSESDLAVIAERFLSLDELVKFTEYVSKDAPYNGCPDLNHRVNVALMVRHLTARRAFRENRMDIAQKYMPKEYASYLDMYLRNLEKSRDKKYSNDERALALYNAAKIMRFMGMELCGTEADPDNHRYDGSHYQYHEYTRCPQCKFDPALGVWQLCENSRSYFPHPGQKRTAGLNAAKDYSTVPMHRRWHYRYTACEMALAAADMTDDQELKALIYYFGGEVLRKQSPAEADIFYKRLVRNCKDTQLGQLADKLRWFPVDNKILRSEVTDIKPCASVEKAKTLMSEAFAIDKQEK